LKAAGIDPLVNDGASKISHFEYHVQGPILAMLTIDPNAYVSVAWANRFEIMDRRCPHAVTALCARHGHSTDPS
jgi:hypothetical protein